MKVSKTALLSAIETALTKFDADMETWRQGVALYRADRREAWMRNKQPKWRDLRDVITASIRKGEPITEKMVKACLGNYSYISDHTYSPATPGSSFSVGGVMYTRPANVPVTELRALKLFLEGSPDEVFSLDALNRMGFKAPAWVFRAAVTSGAQ